MLLYEIITLLLSNEYETIKPGVEDMLNGYLRDCLEGEESREKFSSFFSDLIGYAESKNIEELLKSLRRRIVEERELREAAIMAFREVCDPGVARVAREWGEDLEPAVRMAYLKCLLRLFERGEIGIDDLTSFLEDPSPKIRLFLASSLSLHAGESEVRSFLLRMLARERRSEIRNVIIEALSSRSDR